MDINKLTLKSQEALGQAQTHARELNHQQVAPAHLLRALLAQTEGVVYPLLDRLGANPGVLRARLDELLGEIPKVYGRVETYLSTAARRPRTGL